MVGSWLVKVVLGIALLGLAAIELGSPLVTRAQADDAAHAVADAAALALTNRRTDEALKAECEQVAADNSVELVSCELQADGKVAAAVSKTARSFVLHKFEPTKDWYEVKASATSASAVR